MIPIGTVLSSLSKWVRRMRDRLHRDSRNPYIKTDTKTFGFEDMQRLPLTENDAVAISKIKIAEHDYNAARHVLVNAWLTMKVGPENELALLRLKQGFVELYQAKGEADRAAYIDSLPVMLLDGQMQWLADHPDEDLGGAGKSYSQK